jgi:hypothetical protein
MRPAYARVFVVVAALAAAPSPARAQWGYPAGYGGFGWGGWGATTAFGDQARGMGVFAAGLGQYNLKSATARAINTETAMRFNEYLWRSQQLRNQRYYETLARRRQRINETARTTYDRLRNNPDRADVLRGDALNVILDQLSAPGVYARSVSAGNTPLPSSLVRDIPFRYNPQAISISLAELTDRGVPELLKAPSFEAERLAVKAAAEQVRSEAEAADEIPVESLRRLQAAIRALQDKVRATAPAGRDRNQAENFLRAAFGLARMLETPEIGAFLRELDRTETTTQAALLGFMQAFNLRFGVAETPSQRTAYDRLFRDLRTLRDQLIPADAPPTEIEPPQDSHPEWATEFFSGMDPDEIRDRKPLTPVPAPDREPRR